MQTSPITPVAASDRTPADTALRKAAEEMEAAFLAEMLKPMQADIASSSFGGGPGEAQFSSFLVAEQARAMVGAGGIGLAEQIFRSLAANGGAADE